MTSARINEKNTAFFLVIALLLIFIMAARTPLDTDLWWHLRAGEETIRSGSPMTVDNFSFSRFNEPWTNHSWLSQVILYEIYEMTGFAGLSLFVSISAVLCMGIVSLQMPGKPIIKMFLLVFGGIVASVNWVPRPQILSLVLLALTGFILYQYQKKPDRWIWILPVIFMIWGNLHGGYALGLLLAGCVLAGSILAILSGTNPSFDWREILRLAVVIVIGYLATAINPNGLKTLLIPFQTVNVTGLQNLISEWASPDFHEPLQLVFLVYFILFIWLLAFARKPVRLEYLFSISVFAFLAFTARRNFGPFAIVSLPVMAEFSQHLEIPPKVSNSIQKWNPGRSGKTIPNSLRKVINCLIIVLLASACIIKTVYVTQPDLVDHYLRQNYPLDAVEWVSRHVSPSRVMNEYNWGGFITWQLRDFPVFIDGRTDLFGDEIINEWQDVMQCGSRTKQILNKWDVHLLMVENSRPIIDCAVNDGWQVIYQDDQAAVLTDEISRVK